MTDQIAQEYAEIAFGSAILRVFDTRIPAARISMPGTILDGRTYSEHVARALVDWHDKTGGDQTLLPPQLGIRALTAPGVADVGSVAVPVGKGEKVVVHRGKWRGAEYNPLIR